jgi:hypothetical protein
MRLTGNVLINQSGNNSCSYFYNKLESQHDNDKRF